METIKLTARIIATKTKRAVRVRDASTLSPDPARVFGFAPICVAAEQRIQAIAFGVLDQPPQIVKTWNPLSRDSTYLELFAAALNDYLEACLATDDLIRIWLPNKASLDALAILGHRYRRNSRASEALRRMGQQALALTEEARFEGQQILAITAQILAEHLATGMSSTEEMHLGAMMAWVDPVPGRDPAEEAASRALVPAAALLDWREDRRVEALRRYVKKGGPMAPAKQAELETILGLAAQREWDLMVAAREAFWKLGFEGTLAYEQLIKGSLERVTFALTANPRSPSKPPSLSRLLDLQEYGLDLAEHAAINGDVLMRERARRAGRVFDADVVNVWQPLSSRSPCRLYLATKQEVLRLRVGDRIRSLDGKVKGVVENIGEDSARSATTLEVSLTSGVRKSRRPQVSTSWTWVVGEPFNSEQLKKLAYKSMKAAQSPLAYGKMLPPSTQRLLSTTDDLGAIARQLREG